MVVNIKTKTARLTTDKVEWRRIIVGISERNSYPRGKKEIRL